MLTDTADLTDLADISALPDADLVDTIRTAHHRLTRVQAGFIIALAEFHDRDLARSRRGTGTCARPGTARTPSMILRDPTAKGWV